MLKWFKKHVETVDDLVSQWYWRKKYNSLMGELELLKEVMRDEIYKKVIKTISQPLELARYKRENVRLRTQLSVIRDERNALLTEIKGLNRQVK